jgi:OOP family OmpA-OmpF porin
MNNAASDRQKENPSHDRDELADLRSLLVSPEQRDIAKLKNRLDNPTIHADEVSNVLAEAIIIRAAKDEKLAQALLPTIEQTIKDSVRKDPRFLADAIFPIIGPAIRKAIAESIRAMLQSLNESLSYSFSRKGLIWRLESMRTGKPFAEIVLLHTLIYRVEQIFLIHKETGLVLEHVAAESVAVKDADMVSGMLTAIQDFVHDSFSTDEDQALQSLNVGEFIVWTEQGSQAALAAVIRGNPPEELRGNLKEALERIEFEQSQALYSFNGDTTPFKESNYLLKACLVQAKEKSNNKQAVPQKATAGKIKKAKKKDGTDLVWLLIAAGLICLLVIIAGIVFSVIQ